MIILGLGTNLGDREWNLEQARALLGEALHCDMLCSDILETEAVGFDGAAFLNQAVAFEAGIEPLALLDICQAVERQMGRPAHTAVSGPDGKRVYQSRIIDIDILIFNDLEINTERLTIPHPQIEERPFVKELLNDLTI